MLSPGSTSDDLDRLVGTVVANKYRIERLLGRGGMGAVFSAINTGIGKRVALKFLTREASRDKSATQRFQREAEAASLVESEHIVHVFDSGTTGDGLPFLVMELLSGEDLRARLQRESTLPIATAVDVATQVLRALLRAHAAGIVHRDLKPDNVFLCRRDDGSLYVKLVDFGISKLTTGRSAKTLTRRGTVLGTAYYMAPEQAESAGSVDQRADLYGVGTLLFEMLAGQPPHMAPTHEAVLVAICTRDAPDVRSFRPEVPRELAELIARALVRQREDRIASAEEFLHALGAGPPPALETQEPKARPAPDTGESERTPAPTGTVERKRRSRFTLVAGVLSACVGFTLTAVWVARARRDAPDAAETPARVAPASTAVAEPANAPIDERPRVEPITSPVTMTPSAAPSTRAPAPSATAARPVETIRRQGPAKAAPVRRDAGVASSLQLSTREP